MPWRPRATVPSRSKRSRSGAETEHHPAQHTPGLEPGGGIWFSAENAIIHRRLERIPNALERNSSSQARRGDKAWRQGVETRRGDEAQAMVRLPPRGASAPGQYTCGFMMSASVISRPAATGAGIIGRGRGSGMAATRGRREGSTARETRVGESSVSLPPMDGETAATSTPSSGGVETGRDISPAAATSVGAGAGPGAGFSSTAATLLGAGAGVSPTAATLPGADATRLSVLRMMESMDRGVASTTASGATARESGVSAGRKIVFVAKTQAASPATPNANADTSRREPRPGF